MTQGGASRRCQERKDGAPSRLPLPSEIGASRHGSRVYSDGLGIRLEDRRDLPVPRLAPENGANLGHRPSGQECPLHTRGNPSLSRPPRQFQSNPRVSKITRHGVPGEDQGPPAPTLIAGFGVSVPTLRKSRMVGQPRVEDPDAKAPHCRPSATRPSQSARGTRQPPCGVGEDQKPWPPAQRRADRNVRSRHEGFDFGDWLKRRSSGGVRGILARAMTRRAGGLRIVGL